MYKVMLFDSTNQVMMAEAMLIESEVEMRLVPVPRELSASCGVCIRYKTDTEDKLLSIISDNEIRYKAIYEIG